MQAQSGPQFHCHHICLPAIMTLCFFALAAHAVEPPVIEIDSLNELQQIGHDALYPLDGDYVLTTDIDATATKTWNSGAGFDPIGGLDFGEQPFSGTFDGRGHVIRNLWISRPDETCVGLFSFIYYAEVKGVRIESSQVRGLYYVGGLVGGNGGTVTDCRASCSVVGTDAVGTLIGANSQGIATLCSARADASAENCAGGLIGHNEGTVTNCFSTGRVHSNSTDAGGLIGLNLGTLTNSYSVAAVNCVDTERVGGLIGYNDGTVTNCYAAGPVNAPDAADVGGLVGVNDGYVYRSFWDKTASGKSTSAGGIGLSTSLMQTISTFTGVEWDFVNTWGIDEDKSYPYLLYFRPIRVTSPNGGETWCPLSEHQIQWSHAAHSGANVKIKLYKGGILNRWISGGTPNDGSLFWRVPSDLPSGTDYVIRIYSATDSTYVDDSDAPFSIVQSPIEVTSPNGGEVWTPFSTQEITWNTGTIGGNVRIRLCRGLTVVKWISGNTPNTGEFLWKIPGDVPIASDCTIQICSTTNSNYIDYSDAPFSISLPDIAVIQPNGGEEWTPCTKRTITWQSGMTTGDSIRIKLCRGLSPVRWISGGAPDTGSFSWTVPGDLPVASDYRIQIYSAADLNQIDYSDGPFSIIEPDIKLLNPVGGERFMRGDPVAISWTAKPGVGDTVRLKLFKAGKFYAWISGGTPNDGAFYWKAPAALPLASDYQIQVYSSTTTPIIAMSGYFAVTDVRLRLLSPSPGQTWNIYSTYDIKWAGNGAIGDVKLSLYKGGQFLNWITQATPNDGAFSYTVPELTLGNDYSVKIESLSHPEIFDFTDAPFTAAALPILLTSPNGGESWKAGTVHNITWTCASSPSVNVFIDVYFNGEKIRALCPFGTPNDGCYEWTIPTQFLGTGDKFKVFVYYHYAGFDFSDGNFTITPP